MVSGEVKGLGWGSSLHYGGGLGVGRYLPAAED